MARTKAQQVETAEAPPLDPIPTLDAHPSVVRHRGVQVDLTAQLEDCRRKRADLHQRRQALEHLQVRKLMGEDVGEVDPGELRTLVTSIRDEGIVEARLVDALRQLAEAWEGTRVATEVEVRVQRGAAAKVVMQQMAPMVEQVAALNQRLVALSRDCSESVRVLPQGLLDNFLEQPLAQGVR